MKILKISLCSVCCSLALFANGAEEAAPPPGGFETETAAASRAPVSFSLSTRGSTETNQLVSLNFHGAPLETVLNYLSDAAGYIILPQTDIKGNVDIWSSHPVPKDEAVHLLESVLRKNGYAAVQEGRTLRIVSLNDAKRENLPTLSGNDPDLIPKDDKIVTQILPVRSINASQALKELGAFKSDSAEWTADEAGNAIIFTDARVNIHRMAEIIKALDTASSSVNTVHVYPLKYGDAKTLSGVIKDLFPSQETRNSSETAPGFGAFGGPGGGPGGPGGPPDFGGGQSRPGGSGNGGESNAQARGSRINAVADDQSNSLVISAPEEALSIIEGVIRSVDHQVQDITEVRLFHLKNADPGEMTDLLASLYPDDASGNAPQTQFGGGPPFGPPGGFGQNDSSSQTSDRAKRLGRVNSVADRRTSSVVVTAAKSLMPQIESMVAQLDSNPARKQDIRVISLRNTDPQDVTQILNDLLPASASKSSRSGSSQQGSALTTRSQTLLQQQLQNSISSGFGSSSGSGAGR